jgi:CheY-like chemotaxis protein
LNLILNARHAIKPKGKGEIFIKMYDQNDEVVVIFSDNGIGISDEIKNKIFTPFFSTKGAYSKDNLGLKGSGLGLSVSYKIIQQHDGKISFESFADKGTSFKIILPAVREIPLKKSLTNFINNSWKKDFRILIVDDEVVFIQTIKLLLNKLGYEKIGIANSGKDALNKFSQMKFDTVFLDMLLPDMDGYSILSELKKISDNTPVIFISGQVGLEEKQIEKKGIFGFIQKPFDIKEIDEFLIKIYNEQYKK